MYQPEYYDEMSSYNGTEIQQSYGNNIYQDRYMQYPDRYMQYPNEHINQQYSQYPDHINQQEGYQYQNYQNLQNDNNQEFLKHTQKERLTEKRLSSFSDNSDFGTKRYCCGFFGSKKNCLCFFIGLIVILLVGLTFAGYFLWPRKPHIVLRNPLPGDFGKIYISDQKISSASAQNPFSASFLLNMTVFVLSKNYITYVFDDLKVTAALIDPRDGKAIVVDGKSIGSASSGKVLFLPSKNTTVPLNFNFSLSVSTPLSSIEKDRQVYSLLLDCAQGQLAGLEQVNTANTIPIVATIQIFSKLLSWAGFNPSFSQKLAFPCPPADSGLITALTGAGSPT